MTATAIQQVTNEDVKDAILSLIRDNNAEFRTFLGDISTKIKKKPKPKKKKKEVVKAGNTTTIVLEGEGTTITIIQGERMPFSEMPFWKANPHLKPVSLKEQGYGVSIEALKDLQAFFQEPGNEITDEWFEMLD